MIHETPLLKPQHEKFCQEYVLRFSGRAAAKAAGYDTKHFGKQVRRLLDRADIRKRIDQLTHVSDEYFDTLRRRIIAEQVTIAFMDMSETFDLKKMTLQQLSKIDGRLIKEVKQNPGDTYTVKLWDKQKALDFLGKHLGMVDNDTVKIGGEESAISIVVNSKAVEKALEEACKQ